MNGLKIILGIIALVFGIILLTILPLQVPPSGEYIWKSVIGGFWTIIGVLFLITGIFSKR